METIRRRIKMIDIEDIPRSGDIVVIAYFKGYQPYLQNESRQLLLRDVPKVDIDNGLGLKLEPMLFGILRHVEKDASKSKASRSIGVSYSFSFRNMTPEKYRTFIEKLRELLDSRQAVKSMWINYDVMIMLGVGGV